MKKDGSMKFVRRGTEITGAATDDGNGIGGQGRIRIDRRTGDFSRAIVVEMRFVRRYAQWQIEFVSTVDQLGKQTSKREKCKNLRSYRTQG